METIYLFTVGHLGLILSALAVAAGVAPEAFALLQRRRGGFRSRRRRRRRGGLFGALGALLFIFVFGGLAILVLVALLFFRFVAGRRR